MEHTASATDFVGPDTTAGTFFTVSGASLSQFNGLRYLKYKAYLDKMTTPAHPRSTTSASASNAPTTSVGVASVVATRTARGVAVTWRTGTEARIAGFNVYRGTVREEMATSSWPSTPAWCARRVVPVRRPDARRRPVADPLQAVGLDGRRAWAVRAAAR